MKLIKKLYCNPNYLFISTMILVCDIAPIILSGISLRCFSIPVLLTVVIVYCLILTANALAIIQMFFPMFNVKIFPEAEDVKMNEGLIITSLVVTMVIMHLEYIILC